MILWNQGPFSSFAAADAELGDPMTLAARAAASVMVAIALSVLVSVVYRTSHRGMQYSASFALTLVMLAAVGTLVMMVIGDSLARAFGVFGALSLVRFRTAVKDPKDIAFVFLALAIGMAAGTGRFLVAVVGTAIILSVVLLLSALRFGTKMRDQYLLRVVCSNAAAAQAVPTTLAAQARRVVLLTLQSFDAGEAVEATYLLTLKGEAPPLIGLLQGVEGVTDVHMTATREEIEL